MLLPAFYPILDPQTALRKGLDPVWVAREILAAGAQILQFRHKGFFSRDACRMLEQVAELCLGSGALLVVNDRADLARIFHHNHPGAALHLGQDDLAPGDARRVTGPDLAIGFSTHNEAQLRAAESEPVDYLALGPIFGTATKENPDPRVGLAELRRLRPLTARPLAAIGGITLENARAVRDAGADSVAVIGGLFPEDGGIRAAAKRWIRLLG